jgi:hypothetical protein
MADRQFLAAREVAETRRRMALPLLARIAHTRSDVRPPPLGLGHPRIDGKYRSTMRDQSSNANASRAASSVTSISPSSCALERNQVSNWEGGT